MTKKERKANAEAIRRCLEDLMEDVRQLGVDDAEILMAAATQALTDFEAAQSGRRRSPL